MSLSPRIKQAMRHLDSKTRRSLEGLFVAIDDTLENQRTAMRGIAGQLDGDAGVVDVDYLANMGELTGELLDTAPIRAKLIEDEIIIASDAEAFDYAIDGMMNDEANILVVGAPTAQTNSLADSGAAWVWTRDANGWRQRQKLIPSDILAGDKFGHAVAISGDGSTIAVAAHEQATTAADAGAVYIFVKQNNAWVQQARIEPDVAPLAVEKFGFSISLDYTGDTLLTGMPFMDDGGTEFGAAFIHERSGTTWSQSAKLTHAVRVNVDTLGYSAYISGDGKVAFVGATMASTTGAVFVYKKGTGWADGTEDQKLVASDPNTFDEFGAAVNSFYTFGGTPISSSYDGSRLFIGAYGWDGAQSNIGAVYYFEESGGTWTETQKIIGQSLSQSFHFFGYGVDCDRDGEKLLVSAQSDDDGNSNAGRIFLYERSASGRYLETGTAQSSTQQAGGFFGNRVFLVGSGGYACVAASDYDGNGLTDSGAIFTFEVN